MFTFMSLKLSMARRNLTIGMSDTGMSSRHIAVQFNVNHTVIGRLNNVIIKQERKMIVLDLVDLV